MLSFSQRPKAKYIPEYKGIKCTTPNNDHEYDVVDNLRFNT